MNEDNGPNNQITEDEEMVKKAEEYLNSWKRAQADFANYKKDEAKRLEEFAKYAIQPIVMDVMDAVSDLELALTHVPDPGMKQVAKQFDNLLKKYGVERIAVAGQKFDPMVHEAVDAIDESKPLVEVRPGYTMHGKVIRPARVNNGKINS